MSATLGQLRLAIKGKLATISGLNAYAVEPPSPAYPAAWPIVRPSPLNDTYDGGQNWAVGVIVAVQAADLGRAQTNLDPYLEASGAKSVRAALLSDVSLGLPGVNVTVIALASYGPLDLAGGTALAAELRLEVLT